MRTIKTMLIFSLVFNALCIFVCIPWALWQQFTYHQSLSMYIENASELAFAAGYNRASSTFVKLPPSCSGGSRDSETSPTTGGATSAVRYRRESSKVGTRFAACMRHFVSPLELDEIHPGFVDVRLAEDWNLRLEFDVTPRDSAVCNATVAKIRK